MSFISYFALPYMAVAFNMTIEHLFINIVIWLCFIIVGIHLVYEVWKYPASKEKEDKVLLTIVSFAVVFQALVALVQTMNTRRYWHWVTLLCAYSWVVGYYYNGEKSVNLFRYEPNCYTDGSDYYGYSSYSLITIPPLRLKDYLNGRDREYEKWAEKQTKVIDEAYLTYKSRLELLMDEFKQYKSPYYEYDKYEAMKARNEFEDNYIKCASCLELCSRYRESGDIIEASHSIERAKKFYSNAKTSITTIRNTIKKKDNAPDYSISNSDHEGTHDRSINSPDRPLVPMQEWVPCNICHNSGTCQVCYGNGFTGSGSTSSVCVSCNGTKKCSYCAGNGGHYETVYR